MSLIVVSNRLPVQVTKDDNGYTFKPSSGGLVSAFEGLRGSFEFTWIGSPGFYVPPGAERDAVTAQLWAETRTIPVWIDEVVMNNYYTGYSNSVLWPLCHYRPEFVDQADGIFWRDYKLANAEFAQAIASRVAPGDFVWIQDYQLALTPAALRKLLPKGIEESIRIGWFLHVPFPSSEVYRILPTEQRETILQGILGADLVGFHSYQFARHFASSALALARVTGSALKLFSQGRPVGIGVFPIGITPSKFINGLASSEAQAALETLKSTYGDRKLLLGVDRLDYSKGIDLRLDAFEKLLEDKPELASEVVLLQVAVPSRSDVPEYQALISKVNTRVGEINSRFASLTSTPIVYINQPVPFPMLCALYSFSHACLVTSTRDGMNLVASEFVSLQEKNKGPLILSEFAGIAESLAAYCLTVNPWDIDQVHQAMSQALSMSDQERESRWSGAMAYVTTNTAAKWGEDFVAALKEPAPLFTPTPTPLSPRLVQPLAADGPLLEHARPWTPTSPPTPPASVFNHSGTVSVSYRLPVTLTKDPQTGRWTGAYNHSHPQIAINSPGSLPLRHVGCVGEEVPVEERAEVEAVLATLNATPVWLSDEQGYAWAKSYLYQVMHYHMPMSVEGSWEDYKALNASFAAVLGSMSAKETTVAIVNDYHLLLLPSLIASHYSAVVFFLHVTMPSSEMFRTIPQREELLRGLLGASCIGFQIPPYCAHFSSTVTRVLGLESTEEGVVMPDGSITPIVSHPIGVDPAIIRSDLENPQAQARVTELQAQWKDYKLIAAITFMEEVNGLAALLSAFDSLLSNYGDVWVGKVVLAIVAFGRRGADEDAHLSAIQETVGRINSLYGSVTYMPIHLMLGDNISTAERRALQAEADIYLSLPFRDGYGTAGLQYVLAHEKIGRPGILVLSEFAGSANTLKEAVLANPNDARGVCEAINTALAMGEEEAQERFDKLLRLAHAHTPGRWMDALVKDALMASAAARLLTAAPQPPLLKDEVPKLMGAQKLLLCLDYDGTLVRLVSRPEAAVSTPQVLGILAKLAENPNNVVYVVSGRDRVFLEKQLGSVPGLGLSAEHGLFIRRPSESSWSTASSTTEDLSWMQSAREVMQFFSRRTPQSHLEEKSRCLVWHFRRSDPFLAVHQCREMKACLTDMLSEAPVDVSEGSKILEVRPLSMNKGLLVRRLHQETGADRVLIVGDDRTDEDAFSAFIDEPCALTVHVGAGSTAAKLSVPSPPAVLDLLGAIADGRK